MSGALAMITLSYPFYLSANYSIGSTYGDQRTVYGYIVFIIDVVVFVGLLIYNRQVKKEQNRC